MQAKERDREGETERERETTIFKDIRNQWKQQGFDSLKFQKEKSL